jgi:hypothetical protein
MKRSPLCAFIKATKQRQLAILLCTVLMGGTAFLLSRNFLTPFPRSAKFRIDNNEIRLTYKSYDLLSPVVQIRRSWKFYARVDGASDPARFTRVKSVMESSSGRVSVQIFAPETKAEEQWTPIMRVVRTISLFGVILFRSDHLAYSSASTGKRLQTGPWIPAHPVGPELKRFLSICDLEEFEHFYRTEMPYSADFNTNKLSSLRAKLAVTFREQGDLDKAAFYEKTPNFENR